MKFHGVGVARTHGRIVLVLAVGCAMLGVVATLSTLLSPRPAVSSAPSVDVSTLAPGDFMFARHPVEGPAGPMAKSDILFVRRGDGRLLAFHIPLKDGVRHSPDGSPWQPLWPCERMEAKVSNGEIECESQVLGESRISRWDFEGRGIAPTWSRLAIITGHESDGSFLIHP